MTDPPGTDSTRICLSSRKAARIFLRVGFRRAVVGTEVSPPRLALGKAAFVIVDIH
jgi:hypothetical protein